MSRDYADFLAGKGLHRAGSRVDAAGRVHEALFEWQARVTERLLEMGRAAAFLDTGLGKTIMQCEWGRQIPGRVLFLAPLAVAEQTVREAREKLGMEIHHSRDGSVRGRHVITNYERVELFDPSQFDAVVLDESSILKGQTSATRKRLTEMFAGTRWKLACTATPAPNDHTELGQHADFLGVMPMQEMLMRWFIHDSANTAEWRLKGHAAADFWQWVGSWAACVAMPSDVGGSDEGYLLPRMSVETHVVSTPMMAGGEGELFTVPSVSATDLHATKRLTVDERCARVADLVNGSAEPWVVWCESNEESGMLAGLIPDALEVRGADTMERKEDRLEAFSTGRARVLVSKPSICGFGMNWQHCARMAFASISYSYESFYQAVRRCWRFGQQREVSVHVVISDAEMPVWRVIERKAAAHDEMKRAMVRAVMGQDEPRQRRAYAGRMVPTLPAWM